MNRVHGRCVSVKVVNVNINVKVNVSVNTNVDVLSITVLPNIYEFPLMGLPENESYLGHGDDHTSKYS